MKIKLFSHNDLDGVGCVVVGKQAFKEYLSFECCGYGDIDEKVANFIHSPEFDQTDAIFITDISIKEPEVIRLVNEFASDKLVLLDHHGTAEFLNEYSWGNVNEYEEVDGVQRLSSGTTAFYYYLVNLGLLTPTDELRDFVEQVRSYDSWDWTRTNPRNTTANQLNSLHNLIGRWKFIDRFSRNPEVIFNQTERTILDIERNRVDSTIKNKRKEMVKREFTLMGKTYNVGVVFADNYHSELGNVLAEENPDLDFVVLINGGTRLSFRGVEKGIDLGIVASQLKELGVVSTGGGHPLAAGAMLAIETQENMLNAIFSNLS